MATDNGGESSVLDANGEAAAVKHVAPDDVQNTDTSVPLYQLAWARSGDKGNHANIGVIARDDAYVPYLNKALSEQAVADYMSHVLDDSASSVERWYMPGMKAFNFLLKNSLGGGGIASLRIDPQGKAYAQQLLDMPIPVPSNLIN